MLSPSSVEKTRVNLSKAVVVILDGNDQGMIILRQVFAGFGVRTPYCCRTVEEAWSVLKDMEVDLVVCSSNIGATHGYDFVRDLRHSPLEPNRYAPMVVVSGHTPSSLVRMARDCGANFVVAKPLSPQVLLERIIWIARESRASIEAGGYMGPDRRFQNLGPPAGVNGRRREDAALDSDAEADSDSDQGPAYLQTSQKI